MLKRAFTIIEIILVMALIGIVIGLTISYTNSSITRANFQSIVNELQQSLLTAQSYSRNNYLDVTSGVHFESDQYTLFHANTYDPADVNNRTKAFSSDISLAIDTPFYFAKYTGVPSSSGTITISDNGGASATITISSIGVISVNYN